MRGGQWIKMLDNLKGNDTYSTTKEKAQDREEWKRINGDYTMMVDLHVYHRKPMMMTYIYKTLYTLTIIVKNRPVYHHLI